MYYLEKLTKLQGAKSHKRPPFYINSIVFSLEYLVVAGGGQSLSAAFPAGGGGGGMRTATQLCATNLDYIVTVGVGGSSPQSATNQAGVPGGNSIFDACTAAGGGGGSGPGYGSAQDGGSGGGRSGYEDASAASGGAGNTPSTSPSQGANAGNAVVTVTGYIGAGSGGPCGPCPTSIPPLSLFSFFNASFSRFMNR